MPEEPEIIEEEQETPEEEPETIDPTFTGYKVLIYDRGEENATWQVLLDTSSGENPGIVKASVENKLNEPGQFSYTIAPTHPLYDKTSPMRVYVSVREGQIEIFYGRILSVQTNPLTKLKAVACEGALAFLLDCELPRDESEREMSAADYFKYCIRQYNSAIKIDSETYDELRRLRIGDIDVEDSSEIRSFKNGSYTQIQSVMKNQLLNEYDGCFKIRSVPVRNPFGFGPTTYNHYIDWVDLVGTLNVSHSVRPGINVIDQTNTKSGEDFFTIIRPVGNNDLTLSSNNGLINVSSSMVDEYGKIIRTVNFDADDESALRTKANKYIRKLRDNRLTITGDISFVDYNMLIDDVGDGLSVHVGDRVGLYKDLDYIDASAIVESLTRDLLDPSKDKLSLKSDKDLLKSDHASGAAGSNNSGVKASTKISRGGGGGGSSITEYIKSATLSTDGKTLTLTPAHGTPIDFSKATTLEGAWSSGTLTVSAYQTNKGIKSNVGKYISDHLLALARGGSEISEAFLAELRTVDTGEDVIYPNLRISKDIYLHENVNGTNSNVVAGGNEDGSNPVAVVSTRATYSAGKAAGNIEGRADYKALVRTRFGSAYSRQSISYFIEGYENTSGYASISGSSTEYQLGISGSEDATVVQIQNLSGTRLSNTAELPIGQLYIDGYNAGNANRGSRILSPTVVTSTPDVALAIGTRYKISSQYRQADETWASGGSTVVGVPAVASRFMSGSNNSYYIESYEVTSSATSVPGSTYDYKLGITGEKASSVVRLLTVNNGTIANTPTLNVGSLYILGQNDLKDAGGAVGPIETNGTTTLNQYVTKLTVEVPSSAGYRGLEVGKSSESLAFYNRILASTTSTTASIGIGLNTGSVSTGTGVRTVRVYLGGQAGPYADIYDYRDGKAAERANIKSRFIHDGTNYCIEGYDSSSIETSRTVFTLGVKNSAVRILNSSGNVIGSTPYYSLSNNTYYESGYEAGHSDGWNEGGQTANVAVSTSISSLPSGETSNGTLNAWGKYVRVRPKYTNSEGTEVTITTAEKSLYYKIPSLTSKEYTVSPGETKTIEDINAPISSIKITASNPTISVDDDHASWYSSSASLPSVNATLSRVGTLIRTYKNQYGYVYFSVTAGSKTNTYRIPVQPN